MARQCELDLLKLRDRWPEVRKNTMATRFVFRVTVQSSSPPVKYAWLTFEGDTETLNTWGLREEQRENLELRNHV